MHPSERNRLTKLQTALLLAASDFDQAAAAARALKGEQDDLGLMRALETAIVVCYARAFSTSNLLRLGAKHKPADSLSDSLLHKYLEDRRDTTYAHTDPAGGRRASLRFAAQEGQVVTVEWREDWIPFDRARIGPVIDLCARQALRFRTEAAEIQLRLDAG
jgi:hypothetical protein